MPLNPSACDVARLRYFHALRWLTLWKILLFVFGASIVLFLVTAILFFLRESFLPGALTTLGTIVTGAGIGWVVGQRTTAAAEEKDAFQELKEACSPPGASFVGIRQQPWFVELQEAATKSLLTPKFRFGL